jgi:GrpB-like predicted nucleotidyltransferase (UPF0157 family)
MKTKELIKLLQEEDPSGELECNVDGKDIYFVEKIPGYYDGAYKVLIRDDSKKNQYNINGISIRRDGWKVVLKTMGYDDVLLDNPDAIVEYSDLQTKQQYEESVESTRKENRELIEKVTKQFDGEF